MRRYLWLFCFLSVSALAAVIRVEAQSIRDYSATSDRIARQKPPLPPLGPAGTVLVDPTFGSRILRVTDASTEPGFMNSSFHTTSAADHNTWSANGQFFYITDTGGAVLPYSFDAASFSASRLPSTSNSPGSGGRQVRLGGEPDFSTEREGVLIGVDIRRGSNLHTITEYNMFSDNYAVLFNLGTLGFPLSMTNNTGPYVGYVSVSSSDRGELFGLAHGEKVCALFGGPQQDFHYLVAVFDLDNPGATIKVLDTRNVLIGSSYQSMQPLATNAFQTSFGNGTDLHGATISRDGRYVILTRAFRTSPAGTPMVVIWDTQTDTLTKQTLDSSGHISAGFGQAINHSGMSDSMNWFVRPLNAVNDRARHRPLADPELPFGSPRYPADWAMGDHSSWNNASVTNPNPPLLSGPYRYNSTYPAYDLVNRPWRPWDDEIIAVRTDLVESKVWRFAHHRSVVGPDEGGGAFYFWYTPRPQISRDGRFAIFTSNWEKTLGTHRVAEFGGRYRVDVFLVELQPSESPTPNQPPTVAVTASALSGNAPLTVQFTGVASDPDGRVVGYNWTLGQANLSTGPTATYTFQSAGIYTVSLAATDNDGATSTGSVTITVTAPPPPPPVDIDVQAPAVRITQPLNGQLIDRKTGVTIKAEASDNVGVRMVKFFVNGMLIQTDSTAPYTALWAPNASQRGTQTIEAVAYDAAGNSSRSRVTITIKK